MELERRSIERGDFSQARRGYDPDEVDRAPGRGRGGGRGAQALAGRGRARPAPRPAPRPSRCARSSRPPRAAPPPSSPTPTPRPTAPRAPGTPRTSRGGAARRCRRPPRPLRGRADVGRVATWTGWSTSSGPRSPPPWRSVRAKAQALEAELAEMKAGHRSRAAGRSATPPRRMWHRRARRRGRGLGRGRRNRSPRAESPSRRGRASPPRAGHGGGGRPPQKPAAPGSAGEGSEGARLIALNMALNGTPRDETARYLDGQLRPRRPRRDARRGLLARRALNLAPRRSRRPRRYRRRARANRRSLRTAA